MFSWGIKKIFFHICYKILPLIFKSQKPTYRHVLIKGNNITSSFVTSKSPLYACYTVSVAWWGAEWKFSLRDKISLYFALPGA